MRICCLKKAGLFREASDQIQLLFFTVNTYQFLFQMFNLFLKITQFAWPKGQQVIRMTLPMMLLLPGSVRPCNGLPTGSIGTVVGRSTSPSCEPLVITEYNEFRWELPARCQPWTKRTITPWRKYFLFQWHFKWKLKRDWMLHWWTINRSPWSPCDQSYPGNATIQYKILY